MTLYEKLQKATSEEDVKDVYVKALGLKETRKSIVDIQTDEVWFEAKETGRQSLYEIFTQLLYYIKVAIDSGDTIPPFLSAIDKEKAGIMKTADVLPFLENRVIHWGQSASQYTKETVEEISSFIGTYFVAYNIETQGEEYIEAIKNAIKTGEIVRTQITPDNLRTVFDKWVGMIGKEIIGADESDYVLLFYADIMHDGKVATHENLPARLLHDGEKPVFSLNGNIYNLGSQEGYKNFWQIYHKPPKSEYRNYLLERRDSLILVDERKFKGAYYTPLNVVEKAYEYLTKTLGRNWQEKYIVWDMCCGVGNLESKHSNHRNIFMSTIDQEDIKIMKSSKICVSANKFQYDYLNDDIADDGSIDYTLTNKVPQELQQAIQDYNEGKKGAKKILVLINPPYAETGTGIGKGDKNKKEVEKTQINNLMKSKNLGYSSKEIFVQFLVRILKEIPNVYLAMFSTLKYINASNFEKFRDNWNAKFLSGFIVHSKTFEGLKGDFPIGFLIWQTLNTNKHTNCITEIKTEILDKRINRIGEKSFYNISKNSFLNIWLDKPAKNDKFALPLENSIKVSKNPRLKKSCNNMIGYLYASNNDLQHAGSETLITSSIYTGGNGGGLYITIENIWAVPVVFSVRMLIKHTWINHNDQFLQPTQDLTDEFSNDCLLWMLFSGKNLTASANNLEWDNKKWAIVNHFIPFTEEEVGAKDRFESNFMVQYLKGKKLSKNAKLVMSEGLKLWQAYFSITDDHNTRNELKLNRSDVGWYQIRNALKIRNKKGIGMPTNFDNFKNAYNDLGNKLRPQVYEYGFLK